MFSVSILPLTLSSTMHNGSIFYTARPGYCRAGTLSTGVKKPGPRPGLHWWQCCYSVLLYVRSSARARSSVPSSSDLLYASRAACASSSLSYMV